MKLNYRVMGSGDPLFILHGLFGSSDNWQTLGKQYAEEFEVYLIDQRNHGKSPHSDEFNYDLMAEDLLELVFDRQLLNLSILGHSMGGKTAMTFAKMRPELIDKMVVADIGVKRYPTHHEQIIAGLLSIDFDRVKSRGEVDEQLKKYVPDPGTRAFLMKGLYWKEKSKLSWRMNVESIATHLDNILAEIPDGPCDVECLFISGGQSNYITDEDHSSILEHFPRAVFTEIPGAGHWLHVDESDIFIDESLSFLVD